MSHNCTDDDDVELVSQKSNDRENIPSTKYLVFCWMNG